MAQRVAPAAFKHWDLGIISTVSDANLFARRDSGGLHDMRLLPKPGVLHLQLHQPGAGLPTQELELHHASHNRELLGRRMTTNSGLGHAQHSAVACGIRQAAIQLLWRVQILVLIGRLLSTW